MDLFPPKAEASFSGVRPPVSGIIFFYQKKQKERQPFFFLSVFPSYFVLLLFFSGYTCSV